MKPELPKKENHPVSDMDILCPVPDGSRNADDMGMPPTTDPAATVTYETYTHICCYHDTGVARLTAPPQWEEKCCHCGSVRWRRNAVTIDPQLHGPFLPRGRSSQSLPQEEG